MSLSPLSAMEQYSHYSMWMKSKHILNNMHFQGPMNRFNGSWEEQAFEEDAGFVWPPRSYSCSFCKREFRSAQALGGHMNVHRRDRARLKQSLTPPQNEVVVHHHHHQNHIPSHEAFFKNSNMDPSYLAPPHDEYSPSRVSPGSKTGYGRDERRDDFRFLGHDDTNLSMGLKLVVSQKQPYGFDGDGDDDEGITHKRHKASVSSNIERCHDPFHSELLGLKTGSLMEELDLELRLGDPLKVK